MSIYENVSGTKWKRSNIVKIYNDLDATPSVIFKEQWVIDDGEIKMKQPAGGCSDKMENPSETFDLLNPETQEVIGSMSYQEVYVALHSLYRHVAGKRDAAAAEISGAPQ